LSATQTSFKKIFRFAQFRYRSSLRTDKQLLRIFPVYFSEIGAEGELRDITTKVDELSVRNDKLIYFFRKQSHVESNSLLVKFIEDIFQYWNSGNKDFIRPHLSDEVYEQIVNSGEYFQRHA